MRTPTAWVGASVLFACHPTTEPQAASAPPGALQAQPQPAGQPAPTSEGAAESGLAETAVGQPAAAADLADPGELLALFESGSAEARRDDHGIRLERHDASTPTISGCRERFPDALCGAWHAFNGEYYYVDSSGRPSGALTSLPPVAKEPRNPTCQRDVGRWGDDENPSDDYDGGHMIGHQLGGWGARLNLVPQDVNFNRGNWLQLENQVAECGGLPAGSLLYDVRVDPDTLIRLSQGEGVHTCTTQPSCRLLQGVPKQHPVWG